MLNRHPGEIEYRQNTWRTAWQAQLYSFARERPQGGHIVPIKNRAKEYEWWFKISRVIVLLKTGSRQSAVKIFLLSSYVPSWTILFSLIKLVTTFLCHFSFRSPPIELEVCALCSIRSYEGFFCSLMDRQGRRPLCVRPFNASLSSIHELYINRHTSHYCMARLTPHFIKGGKFMPNLCLVMAR
jgi:hypothetical protein